MSACATTATKFPSSGLSEDALDDGDGACLHLREALDALRRLIGMLDESGPCGIALLDVVDLEACPAPDISIHQVRLLMDLQRATLGYGLRRVERALQRTGDHRRERNAGERHRRAVCLSPPLVGQRDTLHLPRQPPLDVEGGLAVTHEEEQA